jgi:hypothetical protein
MVHAVCFLSFIIAQSCPLCTLDLSVFVVHLVIVQEWRSHREQFRKKVVRDEECADASTLTRKRSNDVYVSAMRRYDYETNNANCCVIAYPRHASQISQRATPDASQNLIWQHLRSHCTLLCLLHQLNLVIHLCVIRTRGCVGFGIHTS